MNWKLYLKPEMSTIYEPETIPEAGNEYYLISMNRKLYLKPEKLRVLQRKSRKQNPLINISKQSQELKKVKIFNFLQKIF